MKNTHIHPGFKDYEKVRLATIDLEVATSRYLEANGWEHSSSNPAHIWLWEKEVNGRTITVSEDVAVRMQQNLDGDQEDGNPE